MKRNRITIYFESLRGTLRRPPPAAVNERPRAAAAETRSGVARPLTILGVVLLVLIGGVVGGAYLWWRHYQSSPAYALALLADAAQRNDTAAIDAIFDTDKVTDDFVSQLKQRGTGSDLSSITSALPTQLQPPTPELTPQIRRKIHDELVKEIQRLTEPAAGKPFILVALAVGQFADIKQEDKVAQATVNIKDEELQLTMQSDANRWRVVAVQDDKLAKKIYESVKRDLPSTGSQLKDEIQKQLDKLKKTEQ